jgi:hypothetical protein
MSAKGMLVTMVAGTALVIVAGARSAEPQRAPEVTAPPEVQWLSREAAAQIVGPSGELGPLFSDVVLGGPAPSPAARARIAEFARENHVAIELDVVDDGLAAVRFAVEFGGCCGYEGADVLALRLRRPSTGVCCVCGPEKWINDWTLATVDGAHVSARVDVNRVEVTWRPMLSAAALIERTESLLGADAAAIRRAAGNRWKVYGVGEVLELPYPFRDSSYANYYPDERGARIEVEAGKIVEVSFMVHDREALKQVAAQLRAQWGRPRKRDVATWTWQASDRIITADLDREQIVMRKRVH